MPKLPAYHTLAAPEFRKKITEVELTPEAERAMGIEPTWPAWKAGTLPLSYARKLQFRSRHLSTDFITIEWGKQDSNLRRLSHQIYSLAHLTTLEFPLILRPAAVWRGRA